MSTVHVVEIRTLTDEVVVEPIARFVLMPAGEARLVELRPHAQSLVERLLHRGVPGADGTWLFPQDGLAFMQRLPYLLGGSRMWATDVFEMDAAEAFAGLEQDA
jgi:hypothetical protein